MYIQNSVFFWRGTHRPWSLTASYPTRLAAPLPFAAASSFGCLLGLKPVTSYMLFVHYYLFSTWPV